MIPRVSDVRKLSEPKEMLAKENLTLTTETLLKILLSRSVKPEK